MTIHMGCILEGIIQIEVLLITDCYLFKKSKSFMLNLISFVIINCLIFVSLIDFLVIFVTNAWPWFGDKKKY